MHRCDVIVLGCGGVGSAALWHLARRGVRVIGFDRFGAGHDRGSSHGRTRIIRRAYFEHPDYVPLVQRAYEHWAELEKARGTPLLTQTGLLEIGPPNGVVVPGVLASARQFNLPVEELTPRDIQQRFPGFHVPNDAVGVFEPDAGYLRVEACVSTCICESVRRGVAYSPHTTVAAWTINNGIITVETDRGFCETTRLVIAAGPWAAKLLADAGVALEVRRKPVHWLAPRDQTYAANSGAPAFLYELPQGVFYGIPQIDDMGVKVAKHTGGTIVDNPLAVNRGVDLVEQAEVVDFATTHLPALTNRITNHSVCMYTMTADEHFIVDRHPRHPEIVFAAGLSGHGFKFAPVLGEALADLALEGTTTLPVEFLRLKRPTLS